MLTMQEIRCGILPGSRHTSVREAPRIRRQSSRNHELEQKVSRLEALCEEKDTELKQREACLKSLSKEKEQKEAELDQAKQELFRLEACCGQKDRALADTRQKLEEAVRGQNTASERASRAEAEAARNWERFCDAEERYAVAITNTNTNTIDDQLRATEEKLRESEKKYWDAKGEVQRRIEENDKLYAQIQRYKAEAKTRKKPLPRKRVVDLSGRLAEAERRAVEAERRVVEAERRVVEEEKRADIAEWKCEEKEKLLTGSSKKPKPKTTKPRSNKTTK